MMPAMPDAVSLSSISRAHSVALVESRTSGNDRDGVTHDPPGTAPENSRGDHLPQLRAQRAILSQRKVELTRIDAQPAAYKTERRQSVAQGVAQAGGQATHSDGPEPQTSPAATPAAGTGVPATSGNGSSGSSGSTGGSSESSGLGSGGSSSSSGHGGGHGWGDYHGYNVSIGNFLTVGIGGRSSLVSLRI